MARRLPNLNALKAFEAAARHLSFTQAAAELNVTQGAISHQVQGLEESLGLVLFKRMNRRLALTDAGRAYLPALSEAFDRIAGATERLRAQEESGQLTVTVLPSFAARWLLPRIGRFRRVAPDIDVAISSRQQLVDLAREPVDAAIRFGLGQGRYPELAETFLMGDEIFPVMAPALRDGRPPPRRPEELRDYPLLHDEGGDMEPAIDWRRWLALAGVEDVDWRRGSSFTDSAFGVLAAIAGEGVALARRSLCLEDLVAGRLVRPFGPNVALKQTYRLLVAREKAHWPKVQRFRQWLLDEVAAEPPLPPALN
mgnify:FL=1